MNFDYKNSLIWISLLIEYDVKEIQIDDCLLDTGSATTAIDIDFIDFNYKKPSVVKRLKELVGELKRL